MSLVVVRAAPAPTRCVVNDVLKLCAECGALETRRVPRDQFLLLRPICCGSGNDLLGKERVETSGQSTGQSPDRDGVVCPNEVPP